MVRSKGSRNEVEVQKYFMNSYQLFALHFSIIISGIPIARFMEIAFESSLYVLIIQDCRNRTLISTTSIRKDDDPRGHLN